MNITDGEVTSIVRALGDRTPSAWYCAGHQQIFVATVEALQTGLAQALLPHLSPARVAIDTGEETVQCLRAFRWPNASTGTLSTAVSSACAWDGTITPSTPPAGAPSIRGCGQCPLEEARSVPREPWQQDENPCRGELVTERRGFNSGWAHDGIRSPGMLRSLPGLRLYLVEVRWAGSAVGVLSEHGRIGRWSRTGSFPYDSTPFLLHPASSCIWEECHCASMKPAFSIAWAVASAPVIVIVTVIAAAIASFIRCLSLNMHRRAELFSYGSHRRPLQGVQPLK